MVYDILINSDKLVLTSYNAQAPAPLTRLLKSFWLCGDESRGVGQAMGRGVVEGDGELEYIGLLELKTQLGQGTYFQIS